MKFCLRTFGCRVNQADGDAIAEALRQAGHEETDDPAHARVVVVNTCTVTHRSDHDARNMVRRLHRANPAARIVVAGCYPERDPEALAAIPGVTAVLGTCRPAEIAALASAWEAGFAGGNGLPSTGDGEDSRIVGGIPPVGHRTAAPGGGRTRPPLAVAVARRGHTRPFVKIQDGCPGHCAYCIVPRVRGGPRSAEPGAVVDRVAELAGQGVREIILTGIHLGLYGRELTPPSSLSAMTRMLLRLTPIERIRFSSIEPPEFDADLLALITEEPRIAPHAHIPLQSGSDRTLTRMKRSYSTDDYRRLVEHLVASRPFVAVGADIIAGFPGETESDFQDSLSFVGTLPMAYLHVFPYSSRPGTPAAAFPDPVDPRIVQIRAARLLKRGKDLAVSFRRSLVGVDLPALTLEVKRGKAGGTRALTDNFIPVALPGVTLPVNHRVNIRIEDVSPTGECRARLSEGF